MPQSCVRNTTKCKWTEETLADAMEAVKGGRKFREVSRTFGIPVATLRIRMKTSVCDPQRTGRRATFSTTEEKELAEQIIKLGKLFYGVSSKELSKLAYEFAEANNIPHRFSCSTGLAGKDWVLLFRRRHPEIKLRKLEGSSINRIKSFIDENVKLYFSRLQQAMKHYSFSPNRIFNVGEMDITPVKNPRALAPKGSKHPGVAMLWERGKNATLICCFSATGVYIPPMIIYPHQRMYSQLSMDGPFGALYGCSKNGWSNEQLFIEYLQHFAKHVKPSKDDPVLLILDNHASHKSLNSYNFCKTKGIVMGPIPPHTSSKLQPLDLSLFSSLKEAFYQECDLHMKNQGDKILPYNLAELCNKAFMKAATKEKAIWGFRSAGVYPFNPYVFSSV